ncbi:MAG: lysophospholipid acyltransferase family protein [Chakrabartia sp.]
MFFFVANHLSWHDIPILGGVTGTAFVAQDGVRKWPIMGWLAAQNKTIFVNRTVKHQVSDQINVIREAIAENWSVTLFPEGTSSDGLGLLPFKPSLFETLAPPPKPIMIQPVLLDFGDDGRDIAWVQAVKAPGAPSRVAAAMKWASISLSLLTQASWPIEKRFAPVLETALPRPCPNRWDISSGKDSASAKSTGLGCKKFHPFPQIFQLWRTCSGGLV